jgi:hypothetical protein
MNSECMHACIGQLRCVFPWNSAPCLCVRFRQSLGQTCLGCAADKAESPVRSYWSRSAPFFVGR